MNKNGKPRKTRGKQQQYLHRLNFPADHFLSQLTAQITLIKYLEDASLLTHQPPNE